MLRGLVHEAPNGQYQITDQYQTADSPAGAGGNNGYGATATTTAAAGGGLETSTSTTAASGSVAGGVDSHLDSFFQSHALTREDVLVLAAGAQIVLWLMLLYLEVSE
jgi:hypothetical protein